MNSPFLKSFLTLAFVLFGFRSITFAQLAQPGLPSPQAGPSATSIQLLRSGRLLAAIQSAPTKWVAEDLGLTVLGTQALVG